MIFSKPPENFDSKHEISCCFVRHGEEFLLLHRVRNDKIEAGKWGMPGGKIERGEDRLAAVVREVLEETGIRIAPENTRYADSAYVRYPEFDFIYHTFEYNFAVKPPVTIQVEEHSEFRWVTPKEALVMDLMRDNNAVIKNYFRLS